jgi:hypothetical protein
MRTQFATLQGGNLTMIHTRTALVAVVAAGALLVGCTAGDSSEESASDTTAGSGGSTPATVASGPAPGVTDDTVKIGVTYVDLESIGDVVSISHGDYETAFQSLFDAINEEGGIHGRTLEPVIVGVNPVGTEGAEAACTQLTQDEEVFLITGFLLDDALLCPLETHQTAVVGGLQTPERMARAQAPWYTPEGSTEFQNDVVRAMAEAGELDGTVGVFAGPGQEAQLNDDVLPLLEELGIEVAESAVVDAPPDDITAINAATAVIAERFDAAGVDQVLIVGTSGLTWASGVESSDYRPQLLLTDPNSILAYTSGEGSDLSILDGAVAGTLYGGPQALYELPAMEACRERMEAHGGEMPSPDSMTNDDEDLYVSGFTACRNMALVQALLEAAGEDLNYGSLVAGAEGLEVDVPIQPEPMVFGSGDAADGDPTAYVADWDPGEVDFVIRED